MTDPPTIVKVSNHIPDDFKFSILSKLPIKSLVRFRCVRKSWSLLFKNLYFMNMYRNNFISNNNFSYVDHSCLTLDLEEPIYELRDALYSRSGERFENKVKLDWPPPFHEDDQGIRLLGYTAANDTLCLYQGFKIPKVVFWNLTTKEFKVLPSSPLEFTPPSYETVFISIHGFGYDPISDDHKVIRHAAHILSFTDSEGCYFPPHDSLWEVYSLRSNSWRKLDVDMPTGYLTSGSRVYKNGVCHWWDEREACLVSFDLSRDVFFRTSLPLYVDDDYDFDLVDRRFMVLNGSVACISTYETSNVNTPTAFNVSLLGELGVKESWTKLFVYGPLPCIDHPIGAGNKGDIFFRSKEDELVRFDMSTQMIEKLGIKHVLYIEILLYKEVLLPIGGQKNV